MNDVQLSEVLNKIETISEFKFFVDTQKIDVTKEVDIKADKEKIFDILDKLFSGTNITYEVYKKQILLKKVDLKPNKLTSFGPGQSYIEIIKLQQTITGTITDENGTPLPGANILEKGTTNGTQADFDGKFSISVDDENVILVVTYIGFATKEVVVTGQSSINIVLEESAAGLDEVVVMGFGTQKKEAVVGAMTSITPSELKIPSSNLTTALAGRISGMVSYQTSGEPGADNAQFFVRGVASFNGQNGPLILIDGVELTVDDLARLQPDDIQSFSVLKDPTTTAIYGARGANGIILVT
ncbi:MAG: TonB-dependent receptor plug domain-containing protein, partial [Arenibacter sp.]|nr:TonB-dependent receptor plug domain-containing protein [Arenibacter sp.]